MGAELLLMQSRWPQYTDGEWLGEDEARIVLVERARALSSEQALSLHDDWRSAFCEHEGEVEELDEAQYEARVTEIVRDRLVRAVETICGEGLDGEIQLSNFAGEAWLLTGGMSYGDYPTECYEDVGLVGDSGIAEAPVARAGKAG